MSVVIDPPGTEDRDDLAKFLWQHNRRTDGRVRCLHADQGDDVASYRRELGTLPAHEHLWLRAHDGERWLGVIGAEYDGTRAWVRGPLVAQEHTTWAAQLLSELPARLPQINRFDAFWQADEAALIATAATLGWQQRACFHVMEFMNTGAPPEPAPAAVSDANNADHAVAMALHEAAFPATYLPAPRLLASLDAVHRLLVWREGGEVLGYLYAQERADDGDGYIDYLAVAPAARGRGIGRGLLRAALHWLCGQRRLPRVSLTVRQDWAPALGLYEGVGFRRVATGAQVVLER